jgi:hypothetical protein
MKIIALVKFNDHTAFVFDEMPELLYTQHTSCLIGEGGIFYNFLFYDRPGRNWKAFAGRKFELPLKNGGVVECAGQWWDGRNAESLEIIKSKVVRITCATPDKLAACYVFWGRYADEQQLNTLRKEYKGPIYEYWDYEKILKGRAKRELLRKYKIRRHKAIFPKYSKQK